MRFMTPLRYPGGKQKLAPFIAELMTENNLLGGHYVEPFAGGAGVAVQLLLSGKAAHVHLNDASKAIYAFWRSILTKTDEFCALIEGASLTIEEWRKQRHILSHPTEFDQLAQGFSVFYLNRTNRSGILSGGVIGGLEQTGDWKIDARFPRLELIHRIEAIAVHRKAITVKNMDAEEYVKTYIPKLPRRTLVYCDPPYFHKADRLYLNHYRPADHARIAKTFQDRIHRPWAVSYDAVPEVMGLYPKRRRFVYDLQYNASNAYKGREVFFVSDSITLPQSSTVKCIDLGLRHVA